MPIPAQLGFFDLANRYTAFSQKGYPFEQLAQMIPWEEFRPALEAARRARAKKSDKTKRF